MMDPKDNDKMEYAAAQNGVVKEEEDPPTRTTKKKALKYLFVTIAIADLVLMFDSVFLNIVCRPPETDAAWERWPMAVFVGFVMTSIPGVFLLATPMIVEKGSDIRFLVTLVTLFMIFGVMLNSAAKEQLMLGYELRAQKAEARNEDMKARLKAYEEAELVWRQCKNELRSCQEKKP